MTTFERMDRQKVIPPVSTKITRKLASESTDHKDVMNYYSSISRDETGAPVKWKMSSQIHDEILPGRASPALTKVARSRSNSRDSSSERKKHNTENAASKILSGGKKALIKKLESVESQSKDVNIVAEGTKQSKTDDTQESQEIMNMSNNTTANTATVKKRGRPLNSATVKKRGRPFNTGKVLKKSKVVRMGLKSKSEAAEGVVKRKRGRPKTLNLQSTKARELHLNGDEDFFKSPHPLTPCNIIIKPKKGRPKETPPTLEPEPSMSPSSHEGSDSFLSETPVLTTKHVNGPIKRIGRPPKKRHKNAEEINTFGRSEMTSESEIYPKRRGRKPKLLQGTKLVARKRLAVQASSLDKNKKIHFKSKQSMKINAVGKRQQEIKSNKLNRKGGRPPGSKNKPKVALSLVVETRLRNVSGCNDKPEMLAEMHHEDSKVNLETVIAHSNDDSGKGNKKEILPNDLVSNVKESDINSISQNDSKAEGASDNNHVKLDKVMQTKDPLHKVLDNKSKVKSKSKILKDSKSMQNVKKKRILTSHAQKHMDSAIAHLPANDLRRKLQRKLLERLSGKTNRNYKQDEIKEGEELESQALALPGDTKSIVQDIGFELDNIHMKSVHPNTLTETRNLSVLVERQRFPKAKKEQLVNMSKRSRPRKQFTDVIEFGAGKFSDNESVCSELSSFSSVSNNSSKKYFKEKESIPGSKTVENHDKSKTLKKIGQKRKYTTSEELDKVIEKCARMGVEGASDSEFVYDFEANSNIKKEPVADQKPLTKKRGRPKAQHTEVMKTKQIGKMGLKGAKRVLVRKQRKMNIFKQLKSVKYGRKTKSTTEKNITGLCKAVSSDDMGKVLQISSQTSGHTELPSVIKVEQTLFDKTVPRETANGSDDLKNSTEGLVVRTEVPRVSSIAIKAGTEMKSASEIDIKICSSKVDETNLTGKSVLTNEDYADMSRHEVIETVIKDGEVHRNKSVEISGELPKCNVILEPHRSVDTNSSSDSQKEPVSSHDREETISKASPINKENILLGTEDEMSHSKSIDDSKITMSEDTELGSLTVYPTQLVENIECEPSITSESVEENRTNDKKLKSDINRADEKDTEIKEGIAGVENKMLKSSVSEVINSDSLSRKEDETTPELIAKQILNSIIQKICYRSESKTEEVQTNANEDKLVVGVDIFDDNKGEKGSENIGICDSPEQAKKSTSATFHADNCEPHLKGSASEITVSNASYEEEQDKKYATVLNSNAKFERFQVRKPISNAEIMRRRKRRRIREKKSNKESSGTGVRKIELRQKISRSPLDNIALKQSIEENEYMKQQMRKTFKRGPKFKSKLCHLASPEEEKLIHNIEQSPIALDPDKDNIDTYNTEEYSAPPATVLESLKKACKPCSVILRDFIKQLQMKTSIENELESQQSQTGNETEKSEVEKDECVESDTQNIDMKGENEINKVHESEQLYIKDSIEVDSGQKAVHENTDLQEEKNKTFNLVGKLSESTDMKAVQGQMCETYFIQVASGDTGDNKIITDNFFFAETVGPKKKRAGLSTKRDGVPRRRKRRASKALVVRKVMKTQGRGVRKPVAQTVPPMPQATELKNKRKKRNTQKLQNKLKTETQILSDNKQLVAASIAGEQTARKTVPPLKIKVQGGFSSKKMYTVESAVESKPSSVDSALDNKPKRKYKSKSKSDSESEKHKSRHHHTKKRNKSPETDSSKKTEKKLNEQQKSDCLKANDPYEANFLEFIQQQEKNENVMASWRSSVVSKASHQLVGGKACKSGDDGSLTVSACAVADTKTSSVTTEKSVTLSKSSVLVELNSDLSKLPHNEKSQETESSENSSKRSDLEHFQQTEKAVGNLVSKIASSKQYCCNHCEFTCVSQNEILEHTKCLHKDELLYSCSICHKVTFKTKQAILTHFAGCHEGMNESYICLPDFHEKQIDLQATKLSSDNIFDRMNNLFDIRSAKGESLKVISSKTAVEADSTTTALDEMDTSSVQSTSAEPEAAENDCTEQVSSGVNQASKGVPVKPKESETLHKDDTDNELQIKIVDVVSLKDQGAFDSEHCIDDNVQTSSEDSRSHKATTVEAVSVKHSELKVPFYPVSQTSKVTPSRINTTAPVNSVKTTTGKVGTTYKCETCHVHAPVLAALVAHLKSSHSNIPKLFQCPYCRDMEGENEAKIHQHIRQFHPTDNPNPPVALSEPAKRNLKTITLKLPEKSESTVFERDIYMCLRCKEHLPTLEMIYNHLESDHREVFVYVCPFCKVFKAKEELLVNNHVVTAHTRNIEDINISLAIDGTQFVRVASLIKDKSARLGPKPSPPQASKPQTESHQNSKQQTSNLTIPFHQNMAPLNPLVRSSSAQSQQSLHQHGTPVRAPQLQGAKKRKATLSESIAQLTMQRQLQQAQEEANKQQAEKCTSQSNLRPTMQQPPPLLRGPPPLIRYDQLSKVSASLVAAQQYLQSGKTNNIAVNPQVAQGATSNIIGQLTISAAQRLQSLNNPQSHPNQITSAPKPIQSALFDTSDPNSFLPAARKQQGPVLNIPQIPRPANKPPTRQESPTMQRNLITGSPLDLSNKSTPEPSPAPQAVQSPSPEGKLDETNPEAFKIFNLRPSAPSQQPQPNIVPQYVRPNTTNTLAYRPTTPHVSNMPVNAVNMVPISLANVSLQQVQTMPQFVRMNFPQALQQVVAPQTLQQVSIPQALHQLITPQSLAQLVTPQSLQQVISPQSMQGVPAQGFQQILVPQSVQQVTSQIQQQTVTSVTTAQVAVTPQTVASSKALPEKNGNKPQQDKEGQAVPMFKCPYCPQIIELSQEEVKPHIEKAHPGSTVLLTPI